MSERLAKIVGFIFEHSLLACSITALPIKGNKILKSKIAYTHPSLEENGIVAGAQEGSIEIEAGVQAHLKTAKTGDTTIEVWDRVKDTSVHGSYASGTVRVGTHRKERRQLQPHTKTPIEEIGLELEWTPESI